MAVKASHCLLIAIALMSHSAAAQAPTMPAVLEQTISGKPYAPLTRGAAWLLVAPDGKLAVTHAGEIQTHILSAEGKEIGTVAGAGAPMGWIGDSFWVHNILVARISIFGPRRTLDRGEPVPLTIQGPLGTEPKIYRPDPGSFHPLVQRLYPNGDLLIRVSYLSAAPKPGYPVDEAFNLRIAPSGAFRGVVARQQTGAEDCAVMANGRQIGLKEFCSLPTTTPSPDGRFIVNVLRGATGADSTRFTVIATGEWGDTLLKRGLRVAARASQRSRGGQCSPEARRRARASRSAHNPCVVTHLDSAMRAQMPVVHQPVNHMLVGNDSTVWLEVVGASAQHRWMILDRKGGVVGFATVPADVTLREINGMRAWGFRFLPNDQADIVRYRIGAP